MKYGGFVNQIIKDEVSKPDKIVLFGQNVSTGSCISGFTRGMEVKEGGLILNTPNAENSLCGIGFGLMISGVPSIFFMKQQDFLLLGIDQLVNTYNFIRRKKPASSFTIMNVVVDSGYEGPQSCFNSFGDICSIARIPGYTVTNKIDVEEVLRTQMVSPGFRIIGVSQRLFKEDLIELDKVAAAEDKSWFQYSEGKDATVVCFNFSLPYGQELCSRMKDKGLLASLFSVNAVTPVKWSSIIEDLKKTGKLVLMNDSKSANLSSDSFLAEALEKCALQKKIVLKRKLDGYWLAPNADMLEINYEDVINELGYKV
ncbi:hypothetical protein KJ577_00540 [bacterium]|nr:hypothetical protein [bacterium]